MLWWFVSLIFVFNFGVRSSSPIVLSGFTGSVTMSILLNVLNTIEPGLGDEVHARRGPKPVSVTPFMRGGRVLFRGVYVAPPGEELRFRVTVVGESLGLKLLNGFDGVRSVGIGGVDASLELLGVEVLRVDDLWRVGGDRFRIEFLSPVRFAKRSTMGRRRRVRFDFCPSIVNILFTTINHYSSIVGLGNELKSWPYLLRWAYNYVYMRDMRGRVMATKHAGRPELGFLGSVAFEIVSKRQSRIQQLWHLLNYAELINVGTGKSMGFGVIKITTNQTPALHQNPQKYMS
ncbi:hypothetical protein Vsou_03930 [Vulcanisaeta souniana JCM 11219]|uniref:CRISPR-associated protein Cas6 C-terminal domain-containing protein n=1 Tax=Vulcanisaeta souniana JCM 11219 TaxID=1293586 RepID=A0A830EC38_9CREN|nr:hypothetical protein Vsou_03930 [Vulcanisaeta souniana JCM 11219]GGI84735.1 hypothetical protein GCM10007112_22140 [Vulcanisaeta souniana JCM 11219]